MLKTEVDQLGLVHEKYQQFYKGVEVDGATYTLHARDGKIMHMTGNYRTVENLNVAPTLNESAAFAAAVAHVGAKQYMWEEAGTSMHAHDEAYEKPSGSLVVVADPEGKAAPRLAGQARHFPTQIYGKRLVLSRVEGMQRSPDKNHLTQH